jgi:hypothetical protein
MDFARPLHGTSFAQWGGMEWFCRAIRFLPIAGLLATLGCTGLALDPSGLLGANGADSDGEIIVEEDEGDSDTDIGTDVEADADVEVDGEIPTGDEAGVAAEEIFAETDADGTETESATGSGGSNTNAAQQDGEGGYRVFPITDPDTGAVVMGPGIASEDCEDYLNSQETSVTTVAYLTMPEDDNDGGLILTSLSLGTDGFITADGTSARADAEADVTARVRRSRSRLRARLQGIGKQGVVLFARVSVTRGDADDDLEETCPVGEERRFAIENFLQRHELVVTDVKTGNTMAATLSGRGVTGAMVFAKLGSQGVTLSVRRTDTDDDTPVSENLIRLFQTRRLIDFEEMFF